MVAPKQSKKQIMSAEKLPENREPHESLKEKLFKKYGKSTTTWPNNMPLEDMEQMVKFRCFSSIPEDAVAMKVMQRLMAKNSAKKQVCALQLTLFSSKDCLLTCFFSSSWRLRMQSCIKSFQISMLLKSFKAF